MGCFCRLGLFIWLFWVACLMFRLFGRGRVLGFGDLPIEVRGWSREVSEVYYEYLPTVSETFTPCPTHRDAYLRRVVGAKAPVNNSLGVGRVLHDAFLTPFRVVSRLDAGSLLNGEGFVVAEILVKAKIIKQLY